MAWNTETVLTLTALSLIAIGFGAVAALRSENRERALGIGLLGGVAGLLLGLLISPAVRWLTVNLKDILETSALTGISNWQELVIVYLLAIALLVVAVVIGALSAVRSRQFSVSIGFALIGAVIGLATGLSKTSVVGYVIPAILTFLGGLTAYLFTTKSEFRPLVGTILISFSLVITAGLYVGVFSREFTDPNRGNDNGGGNFSELDHVLSAGLISDDDHHAILMSYTCDYESRGDYESCSGMEPIRDLRIRDEGQEGEKQLVRRDLAPGEAVLAMGEDLRATWDASTTTRRLVISGYRTVKHPDQDNPNLYDLQAYTDLTNNIVAGSQSGTEEVEFDPY